MAVFYIDNYKSENIEYEDKYDVAKFLDGKSDVLEDTKKRIRITVNQEITL